MVGWVGDLEGGTVLGGWCWRVFLLVVFVCLTFSPSRCGIALRVWWGRLDFAGFGGIGRVFLSGEGGNVGNGRLGWGFGRRNCSGRVFLCWEGGMVGWLIKTAGGVW